MSQEAESDARPGYAFGTAFLPAAENVVGVRGITSCSNHAALLRAPRGPRHMDRHPGQAAARRRWNSLAELDDGPRPQLVASDFGMAFIDSQFPLAWNTRPNPRLELVWPGKAKPFADLQAVSETGAQVEYMTEADIIKQVETTPHAWLSAEERGSRDRVALRETSRNCQRNEGTGRGNVGLTASATPLSGMSATLCVARRRTSG